jgi:hypothetical protein
METWFETVFGLQRDGKVDPKNGLPNLLQLALIAREYEFYLARPPLFVQRVLFGLLAPSASCSGTRLATPSTAVRRNLWEEEKASARRRPLGR